MSNQRKGTEKRNVRAPLWTVGQAIEWQFDAMDRDLSHIRPRQINEYNQIVGMLKLLPGRDARGK